MAFKCMPKMLLQNLDRETRRMLFEMMAELKQDDELLSMTSKTIQYWIVGNKINERTFFALLPGNFTLYKVEVYVSSVTKKFFSGIFV